MLVLPGFDSFGYEYVKWVWCIYEWIACIHYKKILIVSDNTIVKDLMNGTMKLFVDAINTTALHYLDEVRAMCGGRLHVMVDQLHGVTVSEQLIIQDVIFIHS
jgi:hypothetical protein